MDTDVTHRGIAMLRAVAAGRGRLTRSCEPDLFVDGLPCCDQFTAHALAHAGLLRAIGSGPAGSPVPAELTPEGEALLAAA
ncbi:hypothetical protein [Amycolatopsis benzoatilytica]|uniref:hypothetical protein n=1 Tax=Amycolatopsis benzoatilytica TaxID=346045 RepID=UPI00036D4333|nr:hypothetical protein [Amycolatopsis benzoatilytica]